MAGYFSKSRAGASSEIAPAFRTIAALALALPLLGAGLAEPAQATPVSVTFNFNSLANGASNSSVQTYMDGVLGGNLVTVTGSQASTTYNGDGHVVGPSSGYPYYTVSSVTLGTSDGTTQHLGSYDTFIQNVSSSTEISMTFGVKILSVSFDYEIFPDGTCPTGSNCGSNWPDFTFKADGTIEFHTLAVNPGNPGAPYTHSPASGAFSTEHAPQYLGQSGLYTFANGVTMLEFMDWPTTIGIDNLVITYDPTPAPEPTTIALLGSGILALSLLRRRRRPAREPLASR